MSEGSVVCTCKPHHRDLLFCSMKWCWLSILLNIFDILKHSHGPKLYIGRLWQYNPGCFHCFRPLWLSTFSHVPLNSASVLHRCFHPHTHAAKICLFSEKVIVLSVWNAVNKQVDTLKAPLSTIKINAGFNLFTLAQAGSVTAGPQLPLLVNLWTSVLFMQDHEVSCSQEEV